MEKIAIIAGEEELPRLAINYCIKNDIEPFIVKISSQSDSFYQDYKNVCFIEMGKIGEAISYLKKHQVKKMLIVGSLARPDNIFKIKVDVKGAKLLARLAMNKILGDDNLLRNIKDFLIKEGFELLALNSFMKDEFFFEVGTLSASSLSNEEVSNIALGRDLIDKLSEFDVGQAVIIEGKRIVAIEAAEGTDGMLARAGNLVKSKGYLIKAAKRNQILEIDLPCIGPETMRKAYEANIKIIAIEAEKTVVINKEEVLSFVAKNKMKLIAF